MIISVKENLGITAVMLGDVGFVNLIHQLVMVMVGHK